MKRIYLVVGCPGTGKSWVCNQLREKYHYVPHDDYKNNTNYVEAIKDALKFSSKPILIETPFSMSQITEPLRGLGAVITTVFILESHKTITLRYEGREGKPIPKGHLTRQETYESRADESGSFGGTSSEVLDHLRNL